WSRVAGPGSARTRRLLFSMGDSVRNAALRLCRRDADWTMDTAQRLHRSSRSAMVDYRACDPILSSHRAPAAHRPGDDRTQPGRTPGSDEPRADVGSTRRTALVLQHDRLHPDGRGDVLPYVSGEVRRQDLQVHVQLGTWGGRLGVTPGPGDAEAAVLALG